MNEFNLLEDLKFKAVAESMDDGVVVDDAQKQMVYLNPAILNILDYTSEELLGREVGVFLDPQNKAIVEDQRQKREAGQSSAYEVMLQTRDGRAIPFRITATPYYDNQGRYAGSVAILVDLTEVQEAQHQASQAIDDWQHSFNAIEEIMMVTDQNRIIRQVNEAFCQAYDVQPEEALGQPCFKVVHGTEAQPDYCCTGKVLETGRPVELESENHLNGRTALVSVSPVTDAQGKVTGTVHIIKDISETRQQELESLRLNQELVQSFEGITQAMSYMLESRDPYTAGHSTKVAEMAGAVGAAMGLSAEELQGLNIAALLHDIGKATIPLDILNKPGKLTEHEFGLIKAHPETAYKALSSISFPWPVADVVRQHHERMDGSGYPQGLKGDEIHLWARIMAICDTIEAMTAHRPYRAALKKQDAFAVIQKGSGSHYDPEVAEVAFAALGMSDKRIMVVDDDADVLSLVSKTLSRRGWQVSAYEDPAQAAIAFAASPCPVVLTDLVMPGMTGLDILQKVKDISPLTEVILFTGYGEKEQVQAAMRLGAFDFLDKPFELNAIISAVTRAKESYTAKA